MTTPPATLTHQVNAVTTAELNAARKLQNDNAKEAPPMENELTLKDATEVDLRHRLSRLRKQLSTTHVESERAAIRKNIVAILEELARRELMEEGN